MDLDPELLWARESSSRSTEFTFFFFIIIIIIIFKNEPRWNLHLPLLIIPAD